MISNLNWYCKDGKAKNKTQIYKGIGKKFNAVELEAIHSFLSTLNGIDSVYIRDGYLDVYYNGMILYPSVKCLKNDGLL